MAKKPKVRKPAHKAVKKANKAKTPAKKVRAAHSTKMPVRPAAKPAPSPKPAPPARAPVAPPAGKDALAARMAAFSQKVQQEEEAPVAVRSWSEAKADKPASKKFLPKTGQVTPAEGEIEEDEGEEEVSVPPSTPETEDDEDDEEGDDELPAPRQPPQMNPLTGPMAVPKDRELEFEVAPRHKIKRAGKGGEKPEEFGPVELRQATASGGRHITRSLPENLQRAADRFQPLASPSEKGSGKKRPAPERFEVSMDKRAGPNLPDISHWGDVEIGQQTLSGSRKVGVLTPQQEAEARRLEEEKRRAKK